MVEFIGGGKWEGGVNSERANTQNESKEQYKKTEGCSQTEVCVTVLS